MSIFEFIFGSNDSKLLKKYHKILDQIKQKEEEFKNFTLEDVQNKTAEFKELFKNLNYKNSEDYKKIAEILEEIKVPAFALVRVASKLIFGKSFKIDEEKEIIWDKIPYDVQIIGGLAIHDGNISEMKTGEGKTLVATLPAYLNSLTGNTVQIVTVNDYLADRDSKEMGILYNALGVSVGVVNAGQAKSIKKENYSRDIVYATNNELGFDYLRDNMVLDIENKVQPGHFFAIIDEVDSILIDEARTPLIISAPDNEPTTKYVEFANYATQMIPETDFKVDEKQKIAVLKEEGIKKLEKILGVDNIYISSRFNDLHHIENALRAEFVYEKDKDYIVKDSEVLIVDEHTGRVLAGRRYSSGLHQAIEAKEKVEIQQESKTLASITFQNYFRMYSKLAGMTGTAKTEEEEFYKVYGLTTIVIPTNKPIAREDRKDLLFKNERGKFEYVVGLVEELHKKGQPTLVGTVSVAKSEFLSARLSEKNIPHKVLNAKHHEAEAEIVSEAGKFGAVTIATNMAGRGTDIKLGEGISSTGGLFIIGTEKHETRRIDNQLRGRAGRQGDPGITQFLVSPQDDIMRIFGGDKLFGLFNSPFFASLPDDKPISDQRMLTRKIESVQKQVEGHNFDMRKHVLEYDDVMNKHRKIIYSKRDKILLGDISEMITEMLKNQISIIVDTTYSNDENISKEELIKKINSFFDREVIDNVLEINDVMGISRKRDLTDYILKLALEDLGKIKENYNDDERFEKVQKFIILRSIDELWMNHINEMTILREDVAFEGYAQRQPLVVYKEKAFEKFVNFVNDFEYKAVKGIFAIENQVVIEQTPIIDENSLISNVDSDGNLEISNSRIQQKPQKIFATGPDGKQVEIPESVLNELQSQINLGVKNPSAKMIIDGKEIIISPVLNQNPNNSQNSNNVLEQKKVRV